MNSRNDPNPFDEEEVNPFSNGTAGPGSKSRIPQMVAQTLGFGQKHDATVDIPLDTMNDTRKKDKDLAAWEADLKRRERAAHASDITLEGCGLGHGADPFSRAMVDVDLVMYYVFTCCNCNADCCGC
ncbi:Secretory carrier-associated membrane protein 5 [Sarracenia purpurea var. burkii]